MRIIGELERSPAQIAKKLLLSLTASRIDSCQNKASHPFMEATNCQNDGDQKYRTMRPENGTEPTRLTRTRCKKNDSTPDAHAAMTEPFEIWIHKFRQAGSWS
jgi:hypothetical protein